MERNGHKQEVESEPVLAPSFESQIALQALVDELFRRSDERTHTMLHRIADKALSASQVTAKIDSRQT